jgi:hypothetical protein
MGGVADHGLIEIADDDRGTTFTVGHWTEIALMAISADPDARTNGYQILVARSQHS